MGKTVGMFGKVKASNDRTNLKCSCYFWLGKMRKNDPNGTNDVNLTVWDITNGKQSFYSLHLCRFVPLNVISVQFACYLSFSLSLSFSLRWIFICDVNCKSKIVKKKKQQQIHTQTKLPYLVAFPECEHLKGSVVPAIQLIHPALMMIYDVLSHPDMILMSHPLSLLSLNENAFYCYFCFCCYFCCLVC